MSPKRDPDSDSDSDSDEEDESRELSETYVRIYITKKTHKLIDALVKHFRTMLPFFL